jgi:hypothetical protein
MSISTYSELKTAVQEWSKRNDLTARIPDFIRIAEIKIKSILDVAELELNTTLTTTSNVDFVALPADAKTPIALWLADITPLEQLTQVFPQTLPYSTTPARPLYWAVDGANIKFAHPVDAAIPVVLRYSQLFELTDANPTNNVLTKYPDVYLFGALSELADYTFDDGNLAKWNAKFLDAVQRASNLEASDNKNAPLMTEISISSRQRFNINRGY